MNASQSPTKKRGSPATKTAQAIEFTGAAMQVAEGTLAAGGRGLTELASEINRLHEQITAIFSRGVQYCREVGMLLAQVKERMPHGRFQAWIKQNCSFSVRTAERYLQVEKNWGTIEERLGNEGLPGDHTLTGAIRLLGGSTTKRDGGPTGGDGAPTQKSSDTPVDAPAANGPLATAIESVTTKFEEALGSASLLVQALQSVDECEPNGEATVGLRRCQDVTARLHQATTQLQSTVTDVLGSRRSVDTVHMQRLSAAKPVSSEQLARKAPARFLRPKATI